MTLTTILKSILIGIAIYFYSVKSHSSRPQADIQYTYNIVGENAYQKNLLKIAGQKKLYLNFMNVLLMFCQNHLTNTIQMQSKLKSTD
ncbi:hypothetical protein [Acinetobacter sp. DSM 11652]|uniref:hypothetical protein n=1 Tax=Acinetobacter sp. DSM 11652 TaxID=346222 RepID=UPI0008C2C925|nr:hypothetical protein [Acinetobacter sp. DSM 11652]SEM25557.1 hypothetical protein SAMN05216500_11636 [Acinetobacter sp. DSM 11652]